MEQQLNDDSSHYEISLTAGQAFVAFVLLLLSLAASFAFGIMVGRGQGPGSTASADDPATTMITEREPVAEVPDTVPVESEPPAAEPAAVEEPEEDFVIEPAASTRPAAAKPPAASQAPPSTEPVPHFAQLLSTGDQKTAEALAARLIDDGYTTAYVERTQGEEGMIHRVRVRFPSEAEARAAVPGLQRYTSEEIWVTRHQGN